MKKSTIFLLILVYIASFIIVGLFGIQTRAHNEIIYVESITLKAIDEEFVRSKYDASKNQYTFVAEYEDNLIVKLKAEVLPANATNPSVKVNVSTELASFEIVNDVFIYITVNEGGYGSIDFNVASTDGNDYKVAAKLLIL